MFTSAQSQTCLAHLIQRADGLTTLGRPGRTQKWLNRVKAVLQRSITIRQRRDDAQIGAHGLSVAIGRVEADMDRLLANVPRSAEVQRFARHLARERDALFTFLHRDATPATNVRAEQALRPAVVNRKMSAGNNTSRGAAAQATLMTVLHTARKRAADAFTIVVNALRQPDSVRELL